MQYLRGRNSRIGRDNNRVSKEKIDVKVKGSSLVHDSSQQAHGVFGCKLLQCYATNANSPYHAMQLFGGVAVRVITVLISNGQDIQRAY